MAFLSNLPRSAQVAKVLERKIFSGEYPPNLPLPSTRSLAAEFGFSQRVILSAIDRLEKKNLLVRQERRRIFVKARSARDNAKEILFFAFGNELGAHGIYQAVNELILHDETQHRYDFFSRIISSADAFDRERLDREIARLDNLGFIDCALIYSPLDEEAMRQCLALPYPVIFLGEMPMSGKLPEKARLISPNSTGLLLTAAKYAAKKRYQTLAIAYWELPFGNYDQTAFDEVRNYLETKKIALQLFPVSGNSIAEAAENFTAGFSGIAAGIGGKTLLAAHNLHCGKFERGELAGNFDTLTLTIPQSNCRIKTVRRDYSKLKKAIIDAIEEKNHVQHVTADYAFEVVEAQKQ